MRRSIPTHLNKDVRGQYGLIGDAKLALRAMIDECSKLVGGQASAMPLRSWPRSSRSPTNG